MPTIPEYTKGIIKERAIPSLANPQAIQNASATAFGIAKVADTGADLAFKHKEAQDTTWVNSAVIEAKRKKIETLSAQRESRKSNPFGFSKGFEKNLKDIDEEYSKVAPSKEAKKAYTQTMAQMNLGYYESNLSWENAAKASLYADRVEKSTDDLGVMAFRAGRDGTPIDGLLNDADATAVAAGTINPDKAAVAKTRGKIREHVLDQYLNARATIDPGAVRKELDSKKYDSALGADKLERLYKITEENDPFVADVTRQLYDLNQLAGVDDAQFLQGIKNIEDTATDMRNKGEIGNTEYTKVKNQVKTLTSAKVSEATANVSYQFPEASDLIDRSLPPEYRGEAKREVFYNIGADADEAKQKNAAAAAVDKIKKQKRAAAVKKIEEAQTRKDFATVQEAEAAKLDKGTKITIGGRPAVVE